MTSPSPIRERPLSPFMLGPYYRFQLTSVLSFIHRLTGIGLSIGSFLLIGWLVALASGPWAHAAWSSHMGAWYGQVLLAGWSWALMYHLCNGIRHLFWDVGLGFDLTTTYRSGYVVVAASFGLTAGVWILAYLG